MKWIEREAKDLEGRVVEEIAADELWRHTEAIAQWVRLSGSPEEAKAFDYIKRVLSSYGARVEAYEFDSLIGLPQEASLEVIAPERKSFEGIAHALVPSTPPQGVEGELVYLGRGGSTAYAVDTDVSGKIVLIEGLGSPQKARLAEDKGAVGQIFINDDYTHEFAVSVVWGTPTPETASLLQGTPCISVKGAAGAYLKQQLGRGPVRVRMKARSWQGWRKIPVVTGEFKGVKEPTFVLLSGHVDSWYYGAMDNAGANATALEVARVLSRYRSQLRRGLRVAFWSGHSHGRYSGSAWYADNFWQDLHDNCVAHVNIDSTGGKGAARLSGADTMAETWAFAAAVIKRLTGQELEKRRMGRMGDQSFWGCGVPSLFVSLSEQPLEAQRGGFGGGMGWWWHTPEDTLDKLDRDNLLRDARVYALAVARLCTLPVLPFDYSAAADEFLTILHGLQTKAKGGFELGRCLAGAEELNREAALLGEAIERLQQKNQGRVGQHEEAFVIANKALMGLGRILIPINYTSAGPFDQDLAVPLSPLPVLQPVTRLASLSPDSDEYRFLHTRLVRESNKVCHALKQAAAVAREARLKLDAL